MKLKAFLVTTLVIFTSTLLLAETCVSEKRDDSDLNPIIEINNSHIGTQEFLAALQLKARKLYYHLEAPEAELNQFKLDVVNDIIRDRLLAWHAIDEYKLSADSNDLRLFEAQLIDQLSDNEQFDANQSLILNFYLCREEREQLITQLQKTIESSVKITNNEVAAYYEQHPEKFTSPVQNHVAVILVGVEAGLPQQEWEDAKARAQQIHLQLIEGADFSELAKKYSSDISARDGGDMGYQHEGMLGEYVEDTLKTLSINEFSEPFFILEGWAIIKLIERQEPTLNPFKLVKDRAEGLLLREKKDLAWQNLIEALKKNAVIRIDENAIKEL